MSRFVKIRSFSSARSLYSNLTSKQLNFKQCKTYVLQDNLQKEALLLDPIKENIPFYLSYLGYHGLKLKYIVDSHSHADHFSASFKLKDLTGAKYVMHRSAPAPRVDHHVVDGDILEIGDNKIQVIHTPGHTPDSISLYTGSELFPGDTLLIGGCGRTDFSGGDPTQSYESITKKLFTLPDSTRVYPSHDYRFNEVTTIGHEKKTNPRLANKSKNEFVEIMENLGLPLPEKIMEAIQINSSTVLEDQIKLPTYSQLNEVKLISPETLKELKKDKESVLVLDVREPEEFEDEKLKGLKDTVNIPLRSLVTNVHQFEDYKNKTIVCLCRSGMRSATAASVLSGYGFENVLNLKGGLLNYYSS
ncbi:hypothetical protein HK099_007153 [Clydaea vesicula]|uniref:Rhodanese domain-containing protein n=1 Tax=Clydaea vesicula TaxID=447962 RepID=A0AAD5U993_9FUNG|nr:hypothetical protein HK099_007153 [Clydaea vesicula]